MADKTLPDGAYQAADEAFETFRVTEDKRPRDELEAALLAAEPLIRAAERERIRLSVLGCIHCHQVHDRRLAYGHEWRPRYLVPGCGDVNSYVAGLIREPSP
jgi:hypothetical protein